MKKFFCLLFFFIGSMDFVFAQGVYQAHTHVQLISEQNAIVPGQTFWVGFDLGLDEGWHVYWRNPGDSGLSPKIKWDLPSGIKAGDIDWPYPKRLDVGPLTSYGYEHEVLLLMPLRVAQDFQSPSGKVDLHAWLSWLACRDVCIPGRAELNLSMPLAISSAFNSSKIPFDRSRQLLPQQIPSITSRAELGENEWHLNIHTASRGQTEITFYPFRDDVIEHPAAQHTRLNNQGYDLTLTKSHIYPGAVKTLEGIAVNPTGWDEKGTQAIEIHAPVEVTPPSAATGAPAPAVAAASISFWLACFFALIGGLLLNLMPCVLPVLSIKVLHLVERHPDKSVALRHSLAYALGILISIWTLALLLFALKAGGQFAGWGFQFQSPIFCITVALILFVLSLNLFGVFEFSVPSINGVPGRQAGYQASFISGVVTTIVASPCTAPLMGTALALAISQPNIVGLGIFTSLGLGLALPFVVLSAFPLLLSFVPKPGLWMIYLKRVLGVILLACVIWMLWVFSIETGAMKLSKPSLGGIFWQEYSQAAVDQARQRGDGVFLDFTAAWCINCQVNDRLVLQNPVVLKAFRDQHIVAFKADWTKYDPAITQALSSYGRDSIPVYVYYPSGSNAPDILPQLITPKLILDRINNKK